MPGSPKVLLFLLAEEDVRYRILVLADFLCELKLLLDLHLDLGPRRVKIQMENVEQRGILTTPRRYTS